MSFDVSKVFCSYQKQSWRKRGKSSVAVQLPLSHTRQMLFLRSSLHESTKLNRNQSSRSDRIIKFDDSQSLVRRLFDGKSFIQTQKTWATTKPNEGCVKCFFNIEKKAERVAGRKNPWRCLMKIYGAGGRERLREDEGRTMVWCVGRRRTRDCAQRAVSNCARTREPPYSIHVLQGIREKRESTQSMASDMELLLSLSPFSLGEMSMTRWGEIFSDDEKKWN